MEKKKVKSFIIPPTYFKNNSYSITEIPKNKTQIPNNSETVTIEEIASVPRNDNKNVISEVPKEIEVDQQVEKIVVPKPIVATPSVSISNEPKVSALSMKSIRAKKELEAQLKPTEKHHDELPTEPFSETQMLEQWIKYANRLGDKGYKILESLLLLNDPTLDGTTIIHELPNESSKIDFDGEKHDLLGYLRGKLHNHNITIEIKINETIELKKAFTTQEKYDRLKEMNPALDVLRKTFDLDL